MRDKILNANRIVEIKSRLKQLDEEEIRINLIDYQSDSDKLRLREIWREQRALENELKELGVNEQ